MLVVIQMINSSTWICILYCLYILLYIIICYFIKNDHWDDNCLRECDDLENAKLVVYHFLPLSYILTCSTSAKLKKPIVDIKTSWMSDYISYTLILESCKYYSS